MFWTTFSRLCQSHGVAPNAVAAAIGIKSTGTVTGWKRGAMPRAGALEAIADYFGVSVNYLLDEKNISTGSDPNGDMRGYDELNDTNKAIVDSLIDQLLAAQSDQG